MRTAIKDKNQRVIAYEEDSGNTRRLFDVSNNLLATYNKSNNRTYKSDGTLLAEGDRLLLALK